LTKGRIACRSIIEDCNGHVSVCLSVCPSVFLSLQHTHCDSPGSSMWHLLVYLLVSFTFLFFPLYSFHLFVASLQFGLTAKRTNILVDIGSLFCCLNCSGCCCY